MATKIIRYRSAVTGKFVKADYAQQNPQQTIKQTIIKGISEVKKT